MYSAYCFLLRTGRARDFGRILCSKLSSNKAMVRCVERVVVHSLHALMNAKTVWRLGDGFGGGAYLNEDGVQCDIVLVQYASVFKLS
jgi:hypothetical protein